MIVVKAGGRALTANLEVIARSIAKRAGESGGVVFIHGGGDVVSGLCKALGVEPRIITSPSGIRSRYTDERELEVYVMAMAGKINKSIVAAIQKVGVRAVGISGVDGATLVAERKKRIVIVDERGRKRVIDGGYTGQIKQVNTELLYRLLEDGFVVVVSPIAIGTEHELLNVDGDQAAAAIAKATKAEMLVLMSDVDGVIYEGRVVAELSPAEALDLAGRIGPGMNRKLMVAAEAVSGGVRRAIICNGLGDDPMSYAENLRGTLITTRHD